MQSLGWVRRPSNPVVEVLATVEFVEVVVGRLADDFPVETADEPLVLAHLGRLHQALPAF